MLGGKFLVLGNITDGAELKNTILSPDASRPIDDYVGTDPAPLPYLDITTNNAIRADTHAGCDGSRTIDDRRGVNQSSISRIAPIKSPLATVTPSTVASERSFQMPLDERIKLTSMRS